MYKASGVEVKLSDFPPCSGSHFPKTKLQPPQQVVSSVVGAAADKRSKEVPITHMMMPFLNIIKLF